MKPKVRSWIVFPGGTKFGEGRAELLRLVGERGSLKRAVAEMKMSYRAAWGYVRELEAAAGFPFLERTGPGPASGTRLTAKGRAFLASFETFRAEMAGAADLSFRTAFRATSRRPSSRPRSRRR
jgi:molybdate transport system regulatory protein